MVIESHMKTYGTGIPEPRYKNRTQMTMTHNDTGDKIDFYTSKLQKKWSDKISDNQIDLKLWWNYKYVNNSEILYKS